ncbi:MAG: hypothetical protein ACXABV_07915 [Candidatus Thorarchaeota archaeon]|jgi:hypothetical protein
MPEAAFIVQLDDFQGFLVKKRHPSSLALTETMLNLVFFEHQQGKEEEIRDSDIEGMRIASFTMEAFPGWTVCFVLNEYDVLEEISQELTGMGRFMLELMNADPESLEIEEVLAKRSSMPTVDDEQKAAAIFLTPSSALLLERLYTEGVESTAKLSMWLKNQVQSDNVDLKEAITPLMESGLVAVEIIGKLETAFLLKDVFPHRAPPVKSFKATGVAHPNLIPQYEEYLKNFFSPDPPTKGYNPTLPVTDPNSPILEDREKIARILSNSIYYAVLDCLRNGPLRLGQIASQISFPDGVVQGALWAMEAERIVANFEEEGVWALITNPKMEIFLPEFILPILATKLEEKRVGSDTARRYLELLVQTWSE